MQIQEPDFYPEDFSIIDNSQMQFSNSKFRTKSFNKDQMETYGITYDEITGEFCCTTCSYKSQHKYSVIRHLRTHSGIRPYVCRICHHAFTQSSALQRHFRLHTGVKPYICNICQKSFTCNTSLKKHMQSHII